MAKVTPGNDGDLDDIIISEATRNLIDRVIEAQQCLVAFAEIDRYISEGGGMIRDLLREHVSAIYRELHRRLDNAWSILSFLAPISEKAQEYMAERSRTWFMRDDTELLNTFGLSGNYYVRDAEEFRQAVLRKFGVLDGTNKQREG